MIETAACGPCNLGRHEDCPETIVRVAGNALVELACACARRDHETPAVPAREEKDR